MSAHDSWLLEGSEGEPWTEDTAPLGLCPFCECPIKADDAGEFCGECSPRELLASFRIDAEGRVSE